MTQAKPLANDAPTSQEAEIRAVLERYARAWEAGDLAVMADSYHDDFTLHYFGRHPLAGDHVGKAAALATLAEFSLRTQRRLIAVEAIMAGPRRGAIAVTEIMHNNGAAITVERLLLYAVREGRLSECWVYDADQALVDACVGG